MANKKKGTKKKASKQAGGLSAAAKDLGNNVLSVAIALPASMRSAVPRAATQAPSAAGHAHTHEGDGHADVVARYKDTDGKLRVELALRSLPGHQPESGGPGQHVPTHLPIWP